MNCWCQNIDDYICNDCSSEKRWKKIPPDDMAVILAAMNQAELGNYLRSAELEAGCEYGIIDVPLRWWESVRDLIDENTGYVRDDIKF